MSAPAQPDIVVRATTLAEILDLRHAVLRAGLPRETAIFEGDELADTARHVAAVRRSDGRVVGCATLHLNTWDSEPAWQLRGMAVDPALQRAGVGRLLLDVVEATARTDGRTVLLWANARVPAVPFYQRLGWSVLSEEFDIPTAGPHVKIVKRLPAAR